MNKFTFNRGAWSDGHDLPAWPDGEDYDAYLARAHYTQSRACFGSEHGPGVEIYESSANSTFLAVVSPSGSTVFEVLLPDFPSLMQFIGSYCTAFAAQAGVDQGAEITALLERSGSA